MIGYLRGRVQRISGDSVLLDVGGVGYEVLVSARALEHLSGLKQEVGIVIHTDVRETAILLYGFLDYLEREVFLLLKKVKGIGSKLAMTVLSHIGPEALLLSIGRGDVKALCQVPGIGKKTAERVIVELREGVVESASEVSSLLLSGPADSTGMSSRSDAVEASANFGSRAADDASLALEKLGFSKSQSDKAVTEVMQLAPSLNDAGEFLRLALARI
ncbi:MAG: Holliday junction branch migration protein RuvA [bacterium]|nr:Holliday junction branch migration protein RuvA [bacterium]